MHATTSTTGAARRWVRVVAGAAGGLLVLTALASGGMPDAGATAPGGAAGGVPAGTPSRSAGAGTETGAPTGATSWQLRGGYTASGVGLRNRGHGTVRIGGVPAGAKVKAAYLYWSVLGGDQPGSGFNRGRINGHAVTGTLVGSGASPCWSPTTQGYAYRADVTKRVTGNGDYRLRGFASGTTDGSDPFTAGSTPPLAEGASLVVVYAKSSYPITKVVLAHGYSMVGYQPTATTTIPFGFAATDPVGEVRTTFIGADGQSNFEEPASTVNGVPVAKADWDGTDRPVPRYTYGNLWDTDTTRLVDVVKPGDRSAQISVSGGPDCLAWVAQVFSIGRNGAVDTDGDKLLDGWEANGYDADGDHVADVDLPGYGASVVHKDLFVEMDYMGAEAACPCHLPQADDLRRIQAVYARAPFAGNPDGTRGIRLHLDAGAARGAEFNLGGGNLVAHDDDLNPVVPEFNAIKAANFDPRRARIFYYMIWAHDYDGGSSSGNAFAIPNDSFVVTLGSWPQHGTSDQKVGTFVHEFGHALGQKHGGNDHANFKPNYLSVMNYAFQTTGVPRTGGRPAYFGYSASTLPALKENALNEKVGLNSSTASTYKTRWTCPDGSQRQTAGSANGPIDWTCNGTIRTNRRADINGDGSRTTLGTWNNWSHIVYGGGSVGAGLSASARPRSPLPNELTWEQAKRIR